MRRLTVAVVVDDLLSTNPETGETVRENWSEERAAATASAGAGCRRL